MTVREPKGGASLRAGPLTLGELIAAQSSVAPHRVYMEAAGGGRRVTYGELHTVSERWEALLHDLNVPRGARVGIAVADPVDFALVFLGVVAAGRTAAPIDPAATPPEVGAACGRIEPRLVVSDRPGPDGVLEWVTMPPGSFTLNDGTSEEQGTRAASRGEGVLESPAGGVVLSTSGTTGVPKVIHLDQAALLHAAGAVAASQRLEASDRGFNPLPLFHINAEVVGLLGTLTAGAALVLDDRFHRRGFWELMRRHGVTWINAVPAVLALLADLQDGESVPDGIRFARSASAPLPLPVLDRFERRTGIPVVETYGMTEAASQITANPVDGPRKPGSVGIPVGVDVRIGSAPAPPAVVGAVGIRGPSVIRAYAAGGYEDRVSPEGWLDTGDLGYLDEDGYLFLVGRADDVINRSGEKIYPREVEDVVLADPAVSAAAVIGSDHEVLGCVPVAYLVVDGVRGPDDVRLAEAVVARVREHCASQLSRAKRPVAFHVVSALPRGANGKVRRHAVAGGAPIFSLPAQ